MTPVALLLGGALLPFAIVATARWADAAVWRRSLRAYQIVPPANLSPEDVAAWLGGIAASTHAAPFALLPFPPAVLEIRATQAGIAYFLLVAEKMGGTALSGLRASLPAARVTEADNYLSNRPRLNMAAEAVLTSYRRPLAFGRAEATNRAILASLQPLEKDETVVLQWILTSGGTPQPVRRPSGQEQDNGLPWWLEGESPRDADDVRAERLKQRDQLLCVSLRAGVSAGSRARTYAVFGRVWGTLRGQNASGVLLVRRWWMPEQWAARRLEAFATPLLLRYPMLLNVRELAGLVGLPLGGVRLPGLPRAVSRQLPPAVNMPARGAVVGLASYVGMGDRPLALKTSDRLRHMWCLGPTGTGKSTLLANLALQDIAAGRGVALLDPKGDMVADILDRVPEERHDDIVVVSPGQTAYPVGLNVLDTGHGEHARELAVDAVVHLMASLWRSSFGPRTADVLRNALLTLTYTRAADGSANTLVELPEVLLNPAFRAFLLAQPTVPETVRPFWVSYDQMRDGERAQVIGPSMNKIRSFTTRTALRLMLGQSQGVRLDELFTKRRVFLFDLSKGMLGKGTTELVGSLVMAGLWQATLERITVLREQRHPIFMYLDDFQDFLRLPIDLADILAQARGHGVGMVLAHQHLGQLSDDVRTAALGTARTQVTFQIEHDDARTLAGRFAPLTADDLTGLPAWEIAMRPCVEGSTLSPVTGRTLPLPEATTDGAALARASQQRYGVLRADVETAIRARIQPPARGGGRFGRAMQEADV
ncbi:type IV secretory system conjugative DNA transfer family protein [Phytohabitans suffuscus]|uniref:Conjugal transfer protein TraG n=1 Tax=Phytohabitans suffuscus TaxID=624315 RepID=A0A6F8YET8_9ACTN|nr:type IV secretion system DNA-binding domain-containing protein [Phytohabitans suffuscus]BCB84461.1 conjugal transfer protein TraG [Phytohabitans suffuscus]